MEQVSILFNSAFILITFLFSFTRPTITACLYLIFQTSYFGFIPNEILLSGTDVGSFLINISLLFPLFFASGKVKNLDKHSYYAIIFISFFLLYGIFMPVLQGAQGIFQGIKASKSFLTYFYLFYLVVFRNEIKYNEIFRLIFLCSLYFAILYTVNRLGIHFAPYAYEKNDFIQCRFDSFFPLAIAYLVYLRRKGEKNPLFFIIVAFLCVGIFLGDYFSVLATTLALFPLMLIKADYHTSRRLIRAIFSAGVFAIVLYLLVRNQPWFMTILSNQEDALLTREVYNEFRWEFILQHIYLGGGFLHQTSSLVQSINNDTSSYLEGLSFIDAGYVDLFVRFGIIGTILFLSYPIALMIRSIKNPYMLPFTLFIFQFLCVNYTWSVFSFPMGIVVLSIVYSFILRNIYETNSPKTIKLVGSK